MKAMPYSFCAIFLLFFIATGTFAQSNKSKKLFTDAEKAFQEKSYAQTIQLCKEIISSEFLSIIRSAFNFKLFLSNLAPPFSMHNLCHIQIILRIYAI